MNIFNLRLLELFFWKSKELIENKYVKIIYLEIFYFRSKVNLKCVIFWLIKFLKILR